MNDVVVRVVAHGRVQGVGYRAFTESEAHARGVEGWVRNRSDGTVEAVFAGAKSAVDDLCAVCRLGPPNAHVASLDVFPGDRSLLDGHGWLGGFEQIPTA
ncbi:MAG TPA: acylphosphatase [Methylovirgula sp.]